MQRQQPKRVLATVLFTDIVGSTNLAEEMGDQRWRGLLARHHETVRRELKLHAGRELDSAGDGVFASFEQPASAVRCAGKILSSLQELGVDVRAGVHVGECEQIGNKLGGIAVHTGSRIMSLGGPVELLVSGTTHDLVAGSKIEFVDRGLHQLKGIEAEQRVWQVTAIDGAPAPVPLDADEARKRRAEIVPPALLRKRSLGLALTGAAVLLVAFAAYLALRPENGGLESIASDSVGFVDSEGNIDSALPVGESPRGLATSGGVLWSTNSADGSVSRIETESREISQTIKVGGGPTGIAVGEGDVWVANGLDGTVSRIDGESNEVVQTIVVGNGPRGVAFGGGSVWVADSADGTVTEISAASGKVRQTLPVAIGVSDLAIGFDRLWATSPSSSSVFVIDTATGALEKIGVGGEPAGVAIGADSVWVTSRVDGTVSRIDPAAAAVTDTITVGNDPEDILVSEEAVWVANAGSSSLSRIDVTDGAVNETVGVGNPPTALAWAGQELYVTVRSTGAEHVGGVVTVAKDEPVDSLDPALTYSGTTWGTLTMTNSGLVGFRRAGGIQGAELVPDLAESLPTATSGGTSYTFKVRDGISYSNGMSVEPEDLRRQIERVLEIRPKSPGVPFFSGIVGASACQERPGPCRLDKGIIIDESARTITFKLTAPDAEFLHKLALPFAYAVPAELATKPETLSSVPATGPYKIVMGSYEKGRSLTLVRNPRYKQWSPEAHPQTFPDEIHFKYGVPADKQIEMVEDGRADYAANLETAAPGTLETLETKYPSRLRLATREATHYIFFNTRVSPFDRPDVRRAVSKAFSHDELVKRLASPTVSPSCQLLPPNLPGYRPVVCDPSEGSIERIDEARGIIRRSGTAGDRVTVWTFGPFIGMTEYFVDLLNDLGYRADLKIVTPPPSNPFLYFDETNDSRTQAQAGGGGWLSDYPSAASFLRPQFTCAAFIPASPRSSNASEFCDPKIDKRISRAVHAQAEDPPGASVLWPEIERALLKQAPVIPTYNPRTAVFVSDRVGNFQINPQWGPLFDQAWVK
jgi:peptide/nickel transport system substrate-binding protein